MSAKVRRLHLPRGFRRRGQMLLEQQCWLWGQDVRHTGGNLLLEYGFDRVRPPQEVIGASAYQLRLLPDEICPRERVVALWGFGFWYAELHEGGERGIFIGRAAFEPRWSERVLPPDNAWSPAPIHAATRAPQLKTERQQARVLLRGALDWIAHYEGWALARLGETERARQLQLWPQTSAHMIPTGEFVSAWATLAERLSESGDATR